MRRNILMVAAIAVILATFTSCGPKKGGSSATEGLCVLMCDNSFENIMKQEVDVFEFTYPKVRVLDDYASYSVVLDSLMSLKSNIVVLPRDLTDAERTSLRNKHKNPRSTRIAVDAVALIVNPSNPINNLTMDDVRDILSGKVTTWEELYPSLPSDTIRVLFDDSRSSMVKYMTDSLLNGAPLGSTSYAQGSIQAVVDGVRDRRNAIGVIGVSWLTTDLRSVETTRADSLHRQIETEMANNVATDGGEINRRIEGAGVKVLGVRRDPAKPYTDTRFLKDYDEYRAYKPYQTEIYKGFYPLTRSIFMVTTAYSASPAGGLYSFVTGDIGQRIIQKTGVMPGRYRTQVVELVEK